MMLMPDFWNDQEAAQKVINEANGLKAVVNEFNDLVSTQENLEMTVELLKEEPDEDLQNELVEELKEFEQKMDAFELQMLLK